MTLFDFLVLLALPYATLKQEEQTMFDDMRLGFTKKFQRLFEFERNVYIRSARKTPKFEQFYVFVFDLENDLKIHISPDPSNIMWRVPETFNFTKFSV